MAGVGLADVKDLMGHKAFAMTFRYADLAPQHKLAAVRKLDGWVRPENAETATSPSTSTFEASGAVLLGKLQAIV